MLARALTQPVLAQAWSPGDARDLPRPETRQVLWSALSQLDLRRDPDAALGISADALWQSGGELLEALADLPLTPTLALHAAQLAVTQPTTGELVVIEAGWPKDLRVAMKYLRRYGR